MDTIDYNELLETINKQKEFLKPFVKDTVAYIEKSENSKIVVEGAQAAALDIDLGDYPKVVFHFKE